MEKYLITMKKFTGETTEIDIEEKRFEDLQLAIIWADRMLSLFPLKYDDYLIEKNINGKYEIINI